MPLRFNMLLMDEGIDPSEVRLLRHQTGQSGRTPYSLWRDDVAAFESYQSVQNAAQRARFCSRYWASFVVPPSAATLFVGMFEASLIGSVRDGTIDPLRGETLGSRRPVEFYDQYQCRRIQALSEYIGRLSVRWGDLSSASRAWVQRADKQDKRIVELTTEFREESFPGFTKLIRALSEIETMPPSWKQVLRSSRGVYLLACPRTSEHYVGSAYGEDGFLGRWQAYVANQHGGNIGLRIRDPSDYLVSVLEVAGSSATVDDIIGLESTWKAKLHSREIGLNRN
jgi:hypothetical protein